MTVVDPAALVDEQIQRWRLLPNDELRSRVGHVEHEWLEGPAGEDWMRETQVVWDGKPGGAVRVMIDVFVPVEQGGVGGSLAGDDFIRAPDGKFVGWAVGEEPGWWERLLARLRR